MLGAFQVEADEEAPSPQRQEQHRRAFIDLGAVIAATFVVGLLLGVYFGSRDPDQGGDQGTQGFLVKSVLGQ